MKISSRGSSIRLQFTLYFTHVLYLWPGPSRTGARRSGEMHGSLSDDDLQRLYAWVDEITLSRPKRNIARDFSDGVLVAEVKYFAERRILKHFPNHQRIFKQANVVEYSILSVTPSKRFVSSQTDLCLAPLFCAMPFPRRDFSISWSALWLHCDIAFNMKGLAMCSFVMLHLVMDPVLFEELSRLNENAYQLREPVGTVAE